MKKIKTPLNKAIKFIKKIKVSDFFKDFFVLAMIFSGVVLGAVFFYYTNSKMAFEGSSAASLSNIEFGYAFSFTENGFYKTSVIILLFCLINIIIARLVYAYDILAAYILIVSIPVLNIIYFLNTVLLFSFS